MTDGELQIAIDAAYDQGLIKTYGNRFINWLIGREVDENCDAYRHAVQLRAIQLSRAKRLESVSLARDF